MTDNIKFGTRLRELRTNAGMTLRELAEKVNVNFTYLSKIENGALPPPSEKVIRQLAETLYVDLDELLVLAGIIPSDIAEILKDRKARERLRAEKSRREVVATVKKLVTIPKVSLPLKGLYRLALPVFLVIAVASSLWFASPTQALQIDYSSLPSGTLGSTYTFTVTVSIEDTELLPLQQVNITIYNVADSTTYKATLVNLPKTNSSGAHNPSEGASSGTATVTAVTSASWGYQTTGAGYVNWQGTGYYFAPVLGGYGYQAGIGTATITYTIVWIPPLSGWPTGNYQISTVLFTSPQTPGGSTTITKTSGTFTLSAALPPPVGGAPPPEEEVITEVTVDVSDDIDPDTGLFTDDVTISSGDGNVELGIDAGDSQPVTEDGVPITEITITEMADPPAAPADSNRIALTYDLLPDGTQFPSGITLTLNYDPATVGDGTLVISYHDGTTWVDLPGPFVIDPVNGTISTTIYHFTAFGIFERTSAASFTASNLVISPAEVDPGEAISISTIVSNTGGLSGTYDVVLMIDGSAKATESVTIAGLSSQTVTFTTTLNVAGTYTISIDELSGTVTVKAPAPAPEPEPAPPEPAPEPEPTPPVPEPEPEPAPPAPEPEPEPAPAPAPAPEPEPEAETNWWLIGGIIAAVIIIAIVIWLLVIRRRN